MTATTTKNEEKFTDEWSLLAPSYDEVLLPQFQPMYNAISEIVVDHIRSKDVHAHYKLLDYGTGPGEPIFTILEDLMVHDISNIELVATDSSPGMLSLAEQRLQALRPQLRKIQLSTIDESTRSNYYDFITSSLVLPYASSQAQMLQDFFGQLRSQGLLITSHWPHPSEVPFLTLLKRVNLFMATGKPIDATTHLEPDASFSCWNEETTKNLFAAQGFTIQHWSKISLPMFFPNIRTFLSFCRVAPWFNNSVQYAQAEEETKRILEVDFAFHLDSNSSFELPSNVVVVTASKLL